MNVKTNVKLNITAIFTLDQIKKIIKTVQNSESILSIFAGRIYDCGVDAKQKVKEMNEFIVKNSNAKVCGQVLECHMILLQQQKSIQI